MTKIEWTEATWNPTIGCTKLSDGCKNCYAEIMANRLKHMQNLDYKDGFKFKELENRLEQPLQNNKSTRYFVNSMSDLFHEDISYDFLDKVFDVIAKTPHHQYQILTKRDKKMFEYLKDKKLPDNVWLGVTVEDKESKYRIDTLKKINVKIRFLSCEPLLNDLEDLNLNDIHWVIAGGESGNRARVSKKKWFINIKNQCKKQNVAFFFKQWGTWGDDGIKRNKKINGNFLDGKTYLEYPQIN